MENSLPAINALCQVRNTTQDSVFAKRSSGGDSNRDRDRDRDTNNKVESYKEEFLGVLYGSLWGNKSDLSLNPQGKEASIYPFIYSLYILNGIDTLTIFPLSFAG